MNIRALVILAGLLVGAQAQAIIKSPPAGSGGGGGSGTVTGVTLTSTDLTLTGSCSSSVSLTCDFEIPSDSITNAQLANATGDTIKCNPTSSAASSQDCNPLSVANLMSATLAVAAVDTVNTTIPSGPQTIDGQSLTQGQAVLEANLSPSSANGIYIVQSSTWTLAPFFPSTYVIPAGCSLAVFIQTGTANAGAFYSLATSSAVTIGTTAQTWTKANPGTLTASTFAGPGTNGQATQIVGGAQAGTGAGGSLTIAGGANTGTGAGGQVILEGTVGNATGSTTGAGGGAVSISAGNSASGSTGNNPGGAVSITAGSAVGGTGQGGNATLAAGNGEGTSTHHGGNVILNAGSGSGGALLGAIQTGGLPVYVPSTTAGNLTVLSSAASGCSLTSPLGTNVVGQYLSGTSGTCTVTVTLPAINTNLINNIGCFAFDETTSADTQAALVSGTTLTITGTTVSGDKIKFFCFGY